MNWRILILYGLPIIFVSLLIILFSGKTEEIFSINEDIERLEVENSLVLQEDLIKYQSATLKYKFNKKGYMTIVDQTDRELGKLGFVITGKINGKKQMRTSEDFTWTKTINEEIINKSRKILIWNDETNESEMIIMDESYTVYELVANNNNNNFPWTVTLNFDKNNDIKITHSLTNNLGSDITNTKFWYINVVEERTVIKYNEKEYNINETTIQKFGNFNNVKPLINIGKYNFEFKDLINNGFDITNIYVGNGSIINKDNLYIVGLGVTKGNGIFEDGQSIILDPTTSDWIEPYDNENIYTGQFTNESNVFLSDNYFANSSTVKNNVSVKFNILESDGGPVPDGSFIEGIEFSVESRIGIKPGTSTLVAYIGDGLNYYLYDDSVYEIWNTDVDVVKTMSTNYVYPIGHDSWWHKWTYDELNNFTFFPIITIYSANREVLIDQIRIRIYYNPPPVLNNTDDSEFLHSSIGDSNVINQNNTLIYIPFDTLITTGAGNLTASGTAWYDAFLKLSGNSGSFEVVDGKYGNAYKFDATTEPYLSASYREHTRGLENMTISVWVNMTGTSTRTIAGDVFTEARFGTNEMAWRLSNVVNFVKFTSMNNTVGTAFSDVKACQTSGSNIIVDGAWTHVTVTYDANAGETKMYVNGTLSTTCTNQKGVLKNVEGTSTNLGSIRIGCSNKAPNIVNCWDGGMDDFMLLDVVLNDSQISDLYDGTISRFFPRSEKIFTGQSLTGTNNTINISIASATPLDSSINISIGDGSSGTYIYGDEFDVFTDLTVDNPSNYSVKFIFYSSSNNFLSPVMNNDPSFVEFEVGVADSCTYTGGNWVVDCSDNCSLTSNVVIDAGGNVSIVGTGTFNGLQNVTGWKQLLVAVACEVQ